MPLFAALAFLVFCLRLLKVNLGDVDMVVLGLALLALHFTVGQYIGTAYNNYRGTPQ